MRLTSFLYRLARLSADVRAVSSGNPQRLRRRLKNRLLGRALARVGFWRRLWR